MSTTNRLMAIARFAVSLAQGEAAPRMESISLDALRRATRDELATPAFVPPGTPVSDQRTANSAALAQTMATEIGEAGPTFSVPVHRQDSPQASRRPKGTLPNQKEIDMKKAICASLLSLIASGSLSVVAHADDREESRGYHTPRTYRNVIHISKTKGAQGKLAPIVRIVSPLNGALVAPGESKVGPGSP
ncbi:MAG: hypothetical protein ACREXR_18690, partial [Gammaproteobacteria bacterium]